MIHNTKAEALKAIKTYAKLMKEAHEQTGASFYADAHDDSGMEYYVDAQYRGQDKKIHTIEKHFQELGL